MPRLILLVIALCGLIYVRGSSADFVPIWTFWWWAWILATCGIAACVGWVAHDIRIVRPRWVDWATPAIRTELDAHQLIDGVCACGYVPLDGYDPLDLSDWEEHVAPEIAKRLRFAARHTS